METDEDMIALEKGEHFSKAFYVVALPSKKTR